MKIGIRHIVMAVSCLIVVGCANRGVGPQGGPKDSIPPRVVKEVPVNGSVNYKGRTIALYFDEYIQLDNISSKLLICPPQKQQPEVVQVGKSLKLNFEDDLLDSTTYSLDFGTAICDFHEKNPMQGYFFAFSTGPEIDSLEVFGHVYNAADLNPMPDIIVGLQSELNDSAFSTRALTRIGRTDEKGHFGIHNIKSGQYRLYALNDMSQDYIYSPGEGLAWQDSVITPLIERDSAGQVYVGPSDLVLWYFEDHRKKLSFRRARREEPHRAVLTFSAPQDSMPRFASLDTVNPIDMSQIYIQPSAGMDTITLWFRDSALISRDTITLSMDYYRTDSLFELEPARDTLALNYRAPRLSEKVRENKRRQEQERRLELKTNARTQMEVFEEPYIEAVLPVERIERDSIHLRVKQDSTSWLDLDFRLEAADSARMRYNLLCDIEQGREYELTIDSNAVWDIFGKSNKPRKLMLSKKSDAEYATLTLNLEHYDSLMRLQVLNEKDELLRELPAEPHTLLTHIKPGSYYIRMYIDLNGDGEWTTGSWEQKRQPEPVYYFPAKLTLKANWDFEESFDYQAIEQTQSKPEEIRQVKKKKQ